MEADSSRAISALVEQLKANNDQSKLEKMRNCSMANVPVLDGSNFEEWKSRIEYWSLATGFNKYLDMAEANDNNKPYLDLLKSKLLSVMKIEICRTVENFTTPAEIMKNIEKFYDLQPEKKKVKLQLELNEMKYRSSGKIGLNRFICEFNGKLAGAKKAGAAVDENYAVEIFMKALPEEFTCIKNIVWYSNTGQNTLDFVQELARERQQRIDDETPRNTVQQSAFLSNKRNVKCYRCGASGHMVNMCPKKDDRKCFSCGGIGHTANICPNGRNIVRKSNQQSVVKNGRTGNNNTFFTENLNVNNSDDNNVVDNKNEQSVNVNFADNKNADYFYVDSGSSDHYVGNKNCLTNPRESNNWVRTANGQKCAVKLIGDTTVHSTTGHKIELRDVGYIPNFNNLISVANACDNNNVLIFTEKECLFVDKNKLKIDIDPSWIKMKALRIGNSYIIESSKSGHCYATVSERIMAWHRKLGHPGIQKLSQMIDCPSNIKLNCEHCHLAKDVNASHPLLNESYDLMQRISADLMDIKDHLGEIENHAGYRYILHLIEHHSSFGGVYFMKTKGEAVKYVIEFIDFCERQTGVLLKQFFSDNGREFDNYQLQSTFKKRGIHFLTSTPYVPQQNGKIERRNRTIMECARALLFDSKLSLDYWDLAVSAANYLINRWVAKSGIVPIEKFLNLPVKRDHLKVFGCLAYWKMPDIMRKTKLDPVSLPVVFVGYTESPKNYLLLDPRNKNIFKSCNVTFDETIRGYTTIKQQKSQSDNSSQPNSPAATVSNSSSNQAENVVEDDPKTYAEAMSSANSAQWKRAIDKEITDLIQKGVYSEVDQVNNKKPLSTKWVFRKKNDGRFKARLVVRGFEQFGSSNNYAPTLNMSSLKTFLTLALSRKMTIKQFDVSAAFLNSELTSEIYVKPPDGIEAKFWKLNKALYGLKEAPRAWYQTLHDYLVNDLQMKCSLVDQCIFYNEKLMIAVYVDDIIIAAESTAVADHFINIIDKKFEIHDYGDCSTYLGLKIEIADNEILIGQADYIDDVLERFGLSDCNPTTKPMDNFDDLSKCEPNNRPVKELLGCLNYVATRSRPDISVCISHLGSFADLPSEQLWKACKRVLRYLKGTKYRKLRLLPINDKTLNLFTDASFRSDADLKATSGSIIFLDQTPVSWSSKKQTRLTHSTCEAELVAALDGWKQAEPIRQLLTELNFNTNIRLHIDSAAAAAILETNSFKKSRYFNYDIKLLLSKMERENPIKVVKVSTGQQLADSMTKPLSRQKSEPFMAKVFGL